MRANVRAVGGEDLDEAVIAGDAPAIHLEIELSIGA